MLFVCVFPAKQRVDSGFFLHEAEQNKKKEKKQKIEDATLPKKCRNLKDLMDSSDDDFF